MRNITLAIAVAGLMSMAAQAAVYTSPVCGAGSANIPDASGATPGLLSCVLPIFDPGVIGSGDAVTLSLIGLQHEAAADLEVTLTHFSDPALTLILGAPQIVFSRIGKMSTDPSDFGYLPQF